jgi:hypothetical protein
MNMRISRILLAGLLATALAPSASALVLVDNLAEPVRGTTIFSDDVVNAFPAAPPGSTLWASQSFATDGTSYDLIDVKIVAGLREGAPLVIAELRADTATGPGAVITSFTVPTISTGTPEQVTLTPDNPVVLNASTIYHLVFTALDGKIGVSYANTNNSVGPGSFGNYFYSLDGVDWTNFGDFGPYFMQVNVNAVALPLPAVMLLSGLAALGGLKRRRNRA